MTAASDEQPTAEPPTAAERSELLKIRGQKSHPVAVVSETPKDAVKSADGPAWASGRTGFTLHELRQHIEPWLTALMQSEHLSLLAGRGLTVATQVLAGKVDSIASMGDRDFGQLNDLIAVAKLTAAEKCRRGKGNVEDQLRVAIDLVRAFEHYRVHPDESKRKQVSELADSLGKAIQRVLNELASEVLKGEGSLSGAQAAETWTYLVSFLMSFASRPGTRDRPHIFTVNYDRLIEAGAELAGMRLMDRFVGTLSPIFRASRLDLDVHYNPPGIRGEPRYVEGVARFTKLHGSLDWIQDGDHIRRAGLPFGAKSLEPFLEVGDNSADLQRLMIYPNSAKDRETAGYPYVELFRDFAAACCRPNHTLFTYGYGFGDEHINRVIDDMLTIPSTHLVIISYDDPLGRIRKYERCDQATLIVGKCVASLKPLVDHFLPKAAIDKATFRMHELLRARGFQREPEPEQKQKDHENVSTKQSEGANL